MQDGAPPHSNVRVRKHLNNICAGELIALPSRSPDLTPLAFYLWGYHKKMVSSTPTDTREELLQRITLYCGVIRNTVKVLLRLEQSSIPRTSESIRAHGAPVECITAFILIIIYFKRNSL